MDSATQQRNESSEVNQDVNRNMIPMTIDGVIYLVGFGFSKSATQSLSDRLQALIYKDFRNGKAVCENLS